MAIVTQCRHVMSNHPKLLVLEAVTPEGDEPFFGKWVDLHMLVRASGRERTSEQYRSLLQARGFELTRVVPPDCWLVEAKPI